MNCVDSSGWVEYFIGGAVGDCFGPYCEATDELLVPAVVLFEVYKKVRRDAGAFDARMAWLALRQGHLAPITPRTALRAAVEGASLRLPAMDSLIYSVARGHGAELITCDAHFRDLPGVTYFAK